jgi:hypothetical protein
MRLVALLVPATAARARVNGPRRVRRMRIAALTVAALVLGCASASASTRAAANSH